MDIGKNHKNNEGAIKGSFVFLFTILLVIDQVSKHLAKEIYQNYNFAFSLHVNIYLMYLIYFSGISGILMYLIKHFSILTKRDLVAWIMILSGAASNVAERIILGYVRDWIYVLNGVFNLADGYIIIGILILLFECKQFNKKRSIK